ncbi:acyltransferase [Lachnospiraceae bacterium ZAX-1]
MIENNKMAEDMSRKIDLLKFLAVVSIICAHCNTINEDSGILNLMASYYLHAVGTIGVGLFLVLSGYLFYQSDYKSHMKWKAYVKKKMIRICPAWFFCGSLVYIYTIIRKSDFRSLGGWFLWMFGKGTYLYFIPALLACYAIFWFIYKNDKQVLFIMLLSVMSWLLTTFGIFPMEYAYVNILNWVLFFAIGIILASQQSKHTINMVDGNKHSALKWAFVGSIALMLIILLVLCKNQIQIFYWSKGYLVFELIAGVAFLGVAKFLLKSKFCSQLCKIGNSTLAIYLLHMPIAGIVANLCNYVDSFILTLLRPWLVLGITLVGILICKWIVVKLKIGKWALPMIGLK